MDILKEAFSGILYVGRALLRHEDEDEGVSKQDRIDANDPALPHVFIQFDGVTLQEALMSASSIAKGSSGVIVQYQKIIRTQSAIGEVNAWRDRFDVERFQNLDGVRDGTGGDLQAAIDEVHNGAPWVLLDANDPDLDVPTQPSDVRRKLVEIFEAQGLPTDAIREASDEKVMEMAEAFNA